MSYIELSDGVSINTDFVEAVESTDTGCIIHTSHGSYASAFPYAVFMQLVNMEEPKEIPVIKLEPKAQSALDSLGHHFAG